MYRKWGVRTRCRSRDERVCPLRAGDVPSDGGRHRTWLGPKLSHWDYVPAAVFRVVPLVHAGAADGDARERLEARVVEGSLPRCEDDLHGADECRIERARKVRPPLKVRPGAAESIR
jgi:hypothetical protein